jgi:acetylornithine deacetylase/succinyl-diaminopimelate desuccinylase-like protein
LNVQASADKVALRDTVWERISARRLLETTYEFLCIPSPTGEEAAFAERYARTLAGYGLTVTVDREFPASPSVIGKWGNEDGPILQFDGHTDTIATAHQAPSVDFAAGIVRGRGAADMKGGLAAVAEAMRAIIASGVTLKGSVLVTAHGMHEAPLGDQRTLKSLIRKDIHGDAAIVAELGEDFLPLAAKGMAIFRITVSRQGTPMHEAEMPAGLAHPLWAAGRLVAALDRWRAELAQTADPLLGAESIFLGEIHGGDFYNRVPVSAQLVGTHRYAAPRTLEDLRREYSALCDRIAADTGATIDVTFKDVGPPFSLSEDEPIVGGVRAAYYAATGQELPIRGISVVGNAADLVGLAGIPAIYHGVNQTTAHSDDEYVSAGDLERAAKVYAAVILDYLSGTA